MCLFVEANIWNTKTKRVASSEHITTYSAYIPVCTEVIPKRIKELYNILRSTLVSFTNASIHFETNKPAMLGNLLSVLIQNEYLCVCQSQRSPKTGRETRWNNIYLWFLAGLLAAVQFNFDYVLFPKSKTYKILLTSLLPPYNSLWPNIQSYISIILIIISFIPTHAHFKNTNSH
jgi:hypothetical protein